MCHIISDCLQLVMVLVWLHYSNTIINQTKLIDKTICTKITLVYAQIYFSSQMKLNNDLIKYNAKAWKQKRIADLIHIILFYYPNQKLISNLNQHRTLGQLCYFIARHCILAMNKNLTEKEYFDTSFCVQIVCKSFYFERNHVSNILRHPRS